MHSHQAQQARHPRDNRTYVEECEKQSDRGLNGLRTILDIQRGTCA